jgi:hypothetical protein
LTAKRGFERLGAGRDRPQVIYLVVLLPLPPTCTL